MEFPLSPRAKRNGNGYIDHCPAHEDKNPSLSINYAPDGKLLLHCFAGCSFEEIINAAGVSKMLNISEFALNNRNTRNISEQQRIHFAFKIWKEAVPLAGTLGEKYLRSRHLTNWSDQIKFHPSLYNAEERIASPAIICAVLKSGKFVGIHRTFLTDDGKKLQKKMLGPCGGGCVQVGGSGPVWAIAEGIENALSTLQLYGANKAKYLSALSANGMKNFKLPNKIGMIYIFPDNDEVGLSSAIELGNRAARCGWTAVTIPAPDWGDWNDVLAQKMGSKNAFL